jgi:peptidoglycan/xylan/chitin deacetylase (PgdA/CDA1 family)
MALLGNIQRLVRTADAAVAGAYLSVFRERDAVIPFLFHSLFVDERQIGSNVVDPLERTTVARFREFVKYYADAGYRFVGPEDLLEGLPGRGKFALITFDDGYFNNTLALPVLEEFGARAVFFISTEHVRLGKCFWWDVLYRERVARGATEAELDWERRELKGLTTEQIEARIVAEFGPDALKPRGDIDRPFTVSELKAFAGHPLVRIGNHTANHAILTNYSDAEARAQVGKAQAWLREEIGVEPVAVAYPNGGSNDAVVRACGEAGMRLGFTVRPRKLRLPVNGGGDGLLRIGRFTPHGEGEMRWQCRAYRSDLQVYGALRARYLTWRGREEAV